MEDGRSFIDEGGIQLHLPCTMPEGRGSNVQQGLPPMYRRVDATPRPSPPRQAGASLAYYVRHDQMTFLRLHKL